MDDKVLLYVFDGEEFYYTPGHDKLKEIFWRFWVAKFPDQDRIALIEEMRKAIETGNLGIFHEIYDQTLEYFRDDAFQAFLKRDLDITHRC